MNTDPVHTKNATPSCCPQHCETQYESRNTDVFGYEYNFERVKRRSDGERIKCKGSCYLKHECAFDIENAKIKTAQFRRDSSIENIETIRKHYEDVEGYIRSRDHMLQQEMIVVENLTKDSMQTANQRLKEQLAEFEKDNVQRSLYVNEKDFQSSEFDDQCKDPQNLDCSEKKHFINKKQEKYMKMDTNHVHTKYAKTSCCPQHCTTQYESRNTDACGYKNSFERVERKSDGELIKCIGSHNLKHTWAFDTDNMKIKTAYFRKDSSIESVDTIRKYCEDVEGYIRSRDPMLQQEMIVVENLTKDIMQTANQRLKEQLAEFDKKDVRRTLYVNEKELQTTELDDQRKDPQNLDGSEKKKSKNEFLTVIPKILCSEEEHYKQNEHQEVSIDCQLCIRRNKAVNWCNTCEKNICRFCKLYHEKVWLVMDHDIQPLRIDELMCETMNVC